MHVTANGVGAQSLAPYETRRFDACYDPCYCGAGNFSQFRFALINYVRAPAYMH